MRILREKHKWDLRILEYLDLISKNKARDLEFVVWRSGEQEECEAKKDELASN